MVTQYYKQEEITGHDEQSLVDVKHCQKTSYRVCCEH